MEYREFGGRIDEGFVPDINAYVRHLREMVECRTISEETYYDALEFERIEGVLRKNYPQIYSVAEVIPNGNASFLRIPGMDSTSPLVLMSHKDVVHEGKKKWKAAPYGGNIIKGKMYGRGTFDCKASLCCLFEAVESLLREKFVPEKDIYILSTSNEETAGPDAQEAVEYFRDKGIAPGIVIDEGGAILRNPFITGTKLFAMVGAVERSSARLFFECSDKDSAKKIGKAISRKKFGHFEITPEIEELANGLRSSLKLVPSAVFGFISNHKEAGAAILTHAGPDARAFCGASTGWSIPSGKEAESLNNPLRISVSGNWYNKLDELVPQVRKAAEDMGAKLIRSTQREADAPISTASAGFRFISDAAKTVFGSIEAMPYPVLGRTDSRYFIGYAEDVIRFIPLEISLSQMMKFHCPNENIYIDALPGAVAFYREVIKRYCK